MIITQTFLGFLLVCRYVKIGGLQRRFMCFYAILVSMIILIFYFILSVNLIYFSLFLKCNEDERVYKTAILKKQISSWVKKLSMP